MGLRPMPHNYGDSTMQMLVIAIYDRAAGAYGQPFYSTTPSHATRSFADAVARPDPDNVMHRHPDDFELYKLGTYDDQTGIFTTHAPELIALGKQLKPITMTVQG